MARLSRLMRLMQLIELLQSGRVMLSEEIAEILGVSQRTIFRDISTLQAAGFLIVQDTTRGGYHLPHRLALPPSELTSAEVVALSVLARELANDECGIPFQAAAQSAVEKIRRNLPTASRTSAEEIMKIIAVLRPESGGAVLNRLHFETALRAAGARRQLRIWLAENGDEALRTTFDVYRVLCLRQGWHLVGFSAYHREVRLLEFSAVQRVEPLDSGYAIPERFSLDRFLQHSPVSAFRSIESASQRQLRIDPPSTWDERTVASRVTRKCDELRDLLNEVDAGLGSGASDAFRSRLAGCIERLDTITAEISAALPVSDEPDDEFAAG